MQRLAHAGFEWYGASLSGKHIQASFYILSMGTNTNKLVVAWTSVQAIQACWWHTKTHADASLLYMLSKWASLPRLYHTFECKCVLPVNKYPTLLFRFGNILYILSALFTSPKWLFKRLDAFSIRLLLYHSGSVKRYQYKWKLRPMSSFTDWSAFTLRPSSAKSL